MPYERAVSAAYLLNFLAGLTLYEGHARLRLADDFLDVLAKNVKEFPLQEGEENDNDNVEDIIRRANRKHD